MSSRDDLANLERCLQWVNEVNRTLLAIFWQMCRRSRVTVEKRESGWLAAGDVDPLWVGPKRVLR
jgi:hypothetical protein